MRLVGHVAHLSPLPRVDDDVLIAAFFLVLLLAARQDDIDGTVTAADGDDHCVFIALLARIHTPCVEDQHEQCEETEAAD